ncbi:pentapeptide repeat-containing protein [Kovacikia minuta CCNUW1]|uniref:pentapeptide repeat-containing protein n=1 Tax=Kovacikia minuta TaxID=2931930 RepID=UPI001CCED123|nr:pentapeptide repeat-containing protein [Kovacikia minuta]UBF27931.1 pentapeptide repeat-containing protein [Kovacikia minuta CCNUW1]
MPRRRFNWVLGQIEWLKWLYIGHSPSALCPLPSAFPNMTENQRLDFANQDLRNRSFKGKHLQGANFRGADIRGCNFSHALLIDANFERVRTGQTRRQLLVLVSVAVAVGLLVADAVSRLIFGALGQTPQEPAWNYVLALYVSLGIAATGIGVSALTKTYTIAPIAKVISGVASGALVGFFYGGVNGNQLLALFHQKSAGENNPRTAIAGAVLLGLGMAIANIKCSRGFVSVVVAAAGTVTAYGFAFLMGTTAIACLSTHRWFWGLTLSLLSLLYLWLTLKALTLTIHSIKHFWGTTFRNANLTNAQFAGAELRNTDFTGAIGRGMKGIGG